MLGLPGEHVRWLQVPGSDTKSLWMSPVRTDGHMSPWRQHPQRHRRAVGERLLLGTGKASFDKL